MPSKTALIRSGIAVAVLTVAIVAGSLFAASRHTPTPPTIQLSAQDRSKVEYDKAVVAASNADTTTAILLAQRAVSLDSGNTAAQALLDKLKGTGGNTGAGSSTTGGSSGTTTTPSTPGTPTTPTNPDVFLGDIAIDKLLPSAMPGFRMGAKQVMGSDGTIIGGPTGTESGAKSISWEVHDLKSEKDAQAFVDNLAASLYADNEATVNVREATAKFGTYGTRLAAVRFRRGRYAYEVVVTPVGAAADTKTLAVQAAVAFPATP